MIPRFALPLAATALLVACSWTPRALASPQDDLKQAAKKVADAPNYSWKSETENLGDGGGPAGPTEGQTTHDGLTHLTMTRGDNTMESYFKGEKGAIKMGDDWKSLAEASEDNGGGQPNFGRFIARMIRNFKAPATQAMDVAPNIKDLKESEGGALAGTLSEDGAKLLLNFGARRGAAGGNADNNGPQVANAKGSARFWVKDGQLAKMEYTVQGTVSFNGNDREINRKTTVEIKDVGSTKLEVPADVKKKME